MKCSSSFRILRNFDIALFGATFLKAWTEHVPETEKLGCTGMAFLAEYQHRVRHRYRYAYHTGTKVPNAYQRAKLKFKKYGYVWVRQGYIWVPYRYVFWIKKYKNPPKNHYLPYFSFNLSPHPPIRRQSYRTSNQKVLKTHTRK